MQIAIRRLAARFVCLALLTTGLFSPARATAFTARDIATISSSYISSFYLVNGTNGYIRDRQTGGIAYFWTQAEIIECVLDAYEWTGNPTYQAMITNLLNGFITQNGANWSWNEYNDDIMWAVIAFTRGGVLTGRSNYIAIAKSNFDLCYARAWDTVLGGGLYWRTDNASKNACVNGPGSIAASLLYQVYGDVSYSNKAAAIYAWQRSVLFNLNTGSVADNIGTNGVVNGGATTYNQGTHIGAAHFLGFTNDAALAANFTMLNMTTSGLLPQYGIDGNDSGFNAIFLRWLKRYARDRNLEHIYQPWIQRNALAAWNGRRADNLSWCQWLQPTPAGVNFFSWDCTSSFQVMNAAAPLQATSPFALPQDMIGYWPLDASSANSTTDFSGNNNHGRVTNATVNASGRVNGCFNFNGANSLVQITNSLANDFSIAFWVRTTQTAGTPQWYNGAGLIDGDVPFAANDFGVSLVGNKLAFGVGNPDMTITSANAINDGQWHYCVVTRRQSDGAMRIYIDGALQGTGMGSRNTLSAPTRLLLGAISSGSGFFNGSLDDVKLFRRVLSPNEVTAVYQAHFVAPYAAPEEMTTTTVSGQVQLRWAEAPLATRYHLKRSLVAGGPYTTIATVTNTTFTDTTALNNRTYHYVVSAVNDHGESTNSSPATVNASSLIARFKADSLTNLANGAAISLWPDETGNGHHAVQNLTANRPTFIANGLNGQPSVRFNAANSSYLWLYRPIQDDFTIVFVFKSSQGLNTGTSFWEGAGLLSGERPSPVNDFGISLNANGRILAGTGNPDITLQSSSGFNNGQPQIVTFKRTRSNGSIMLYVNGTLVAAGTGGTQSLTSPSFLVVGGQGVLNNFLTGDISEVQIHGAALSDADRLNIERALRCQYGLSGGTTPTAPLALSGSAANRQISLNWMLVPGATEYQLSRSTDNGQSYELIASNLTTSSYVDTTAINGEINYYCVTALNSCGAGANSASIGIQLPLPGLVMTTTASDLTLTWPSWASDWILLSATNLTPPALWSPVTNQISSNANGFSVTLPIGTGTEFFRLASP